MFSIGDWYIFNQLVHFPASYVSLLEYKVLCSPMSQCFLNSLEKVRKIEATETPFQTDIFISFHTSFRRCHTNGCDKKNTPWSTRAPITGAKMVFNAPAEGFHVSETHSKVWSSCDLLIAYPPNEKYLYTSKISGKTGCLIFHRILLHLHDFWRANLSFLGNPRLKHVKTSDNPNLNLQKLFLPALIPLPPLTLTKSPATRNGCWKVSSRCWKRSVLRSGEVKKRPSIHFRQLSSCHLVLIMSILKGYHQSVPPKFSSSIICNNL